MFAQDASRRLERTKRQHRDQKRDQRMAAPRQAGAKAGDGSDQHQSFSGQVQNAGTLGNNQAECRERVRRGRTRRVGKPID